MVNGLFRGNDAVADALLEVFAGVSGNLSPFFGDSGILAQAFRVALLTELRGGFFGQRVQQQFMLVILSRRFSLVRPLRISMVLMRRVIQASE